MLKWIYVSICYITRIKHLHEPSVSIACSAGVFFGRANAFGRESAILKLPEERRKWGGVKGGGEREEKTPSLTPLSFFRSRTYPKGYYFYSPQSSTVIKSKMAATGYRLQQYEHEQGFAHPKYACTAGYLSVMHQFHDFFYSLLASFPWSAIILTNGCSSSSLARGRLSGSLERKNSLQYGESNIYTCNVPSDLKMPKLEEIFQTVVIVGHRYERLKVLKMFTKLL